MQNSDDTPHNPLATTGVSLSEEALHRDTLRANKCGVRFSAIAKQHDIPNAPVVHLGVRGSASAAIELAKSSDAVLAQVMVNGSGPYWRSDEPDALYPQALDTACRDAQLSPEAAALSRDLEDLQGRHGRILAESVLQEAVAMIADCVDEKNAMARLASDPLNLSHEQANHLLVNLRLRALTHKGRRDLNTQAMETASEIEVCETRLDEANSSSLHDKP